MSEKQYSIDYKKDRCPECGGKIVDTNSNKICSECGLVLEIQFKESSYIFDDLKKINDLSKQYVALGDRIDFIGGLGSFIGYENSKYLKDKSGKLLPPNEQKLFRRLKKNYSQFLRIKNHETEYRVFNILNKISTHLNLNNKIRSSAAYYYRKILKQEEKVINNISLIAFCIFYAARKESQNAPITINEISEVFQNFGYRVNPRLILRDGLKYKKHLNLKARPHKSEDYIHRLISNIFEYDKLEERMKYKGVSWTKLEYKGYLTQKCFEILIRLSFNKRGGRNPFILASAVIYLADKMLAVENKQKSILTQRIISDATKIAEYSIRDHYVNLLKPLFFY